MQKSEAIQLAIELYFPNLEAQLNTFRKRVPNIDTLDYSNFIAFISKEEYNLIDLNISRGSITALLDSILPDRRNTRLSKSKPCTYILFVAGLKSCARCNQVYFFDNFRKNKGNSTGYNTYCKDCHLETTASTQVGRQSNYRAAKEQRTVPWSELGAIKAFCNNCPEGYHVDHIIPLNGEKVSGLHVLSNLQYLPASDNCSKSNSYNID